MWDKDSIFQNLTDLMRDNGIGIEQAAKLFEDLNNGDYEQVDLDAAILKMNKIKNESDHSNIDKDTPEAAAAWVVSDQEARFNYERNTQKIDPSTDGKVDLVEKMGSVGPDEHDDH